MKKEGKVMKKIMTVSISVLSLLFMLSFAMASNDTPEERGKALFNDPTFAGGQKACSECHPDGKGLENAAGKKEFHIMGKEQRNLREAVNFCIVNASKGKAIDVKSEQMRDIVKYIKSLSGRKRGEDTGGYK